jgi:hypothetical protein
MKMSSAVVVLLAGCAAAPPPPTADPPARPVVVPDAALPDAAPPPDPLADAAPYVFRFTTAQRAETWTLRFGSGAAAIDVVSASATQHYRGTAVDGASLVISATTASGKVALDCKHTKRAVSAKCNDAKAKPIDVLDCYAPDFATPMPFAPAPGIEYVVDAKCNGYRLGAQ